MARLARVVVPGVAHHVTQRENRRLQTFFSDDDYASYLSLLSEWCGRCGVQVWAYCLMPNHVHLVVVPQSEDGLRRGLGEAHRRYTRYLFEGCRMKITCAQRIVALAYMLVLVSGPVFSEESTAREYALRYTVYEDIHFVVERTTTQARGGDSNASESGHQKAVIAYGPKTGKTGVIMTPQVKMLSEDGQCYKVFAWFIPVKYRTALGHWNEGWRWGTRSMARGHDMFPVFPEEAVSVGDQWHIEGTLLLPCFQGRAEGRITHTFEALENVGGTTCAKITYEFSNTFDSSEHPETLVDRKMQQSQPIYTAAVAGTAWFDPEKGVVVKQNHHGRTTEQWTGRLNKSLIRQFPHWRSYVDDARTIDVTARLISRQEAESLMAQAETVADDKKQDSEPKEVAKKEGPSWTYSVKRTMATHDRQTDKHDSTTIRARVHYGAGAKLADGQIDAVPQVVYVDAKDQRLNEHSSRQPPLIAMRSEKFGMMDNLPEELGADPNSPVLAHIFSQFLEIPPLKPTQELRKGLNWNRTLYARVGTSKIVFPVMIEHQVRGFEQHQERRCAVIDYSIGGEVRTEDHPEMIPEHQRGELKSVYRMHGDGTVYFDTSEDVLVEKEQSTTWEVLGWRLAKTDDGNIGWATSEDQAMTTNIHVLLTKHDEVTKYTLWLAIALTASGLCLLYFWARRARKAEE